MSTTNKNKKSISETLLEMDELTKAIKKESKETISQLLSEAVKEAINGAIDDEDEDDYEIEDDAEMDTDIEEETPDMGGEEAADVAEDDEWNEFDSFKVGDDAYDLSGEEGDESVMKVFKLLNDDDTVIVKKEGDSISLKDNETGAEYVIKTGCDETCTETPEVETPDMDTEFDDVDVDDETGDDEFEFEFGGDDEEGDDTDSDFDADEDMDADFEEDNNDEEDETMKEGKEMVFEIDLGYTDNYQDKDPIKGLSNNEPSKSGKSWHKGVPQDTKKPWAGKTDGKAKPFEKKVACCEEKLNEAISPAILAAIPELIKNLPEIMKASPEFLEAVQKCIPMPRMLRRQMGEGNDLNLDAPVDEMANTENVLPEGTNVTLPNRRKKSKSHSMQQKDYPKVAHQDSKNGDYKALEETCKKLQKENKELKTIIPQIKKAMNESVIVNYKLGRIVKLFSENTTTKKEKIDIINRFNEEAKTINETKALYESVKRELNGNVKATPMFENKIETANKTSLTESTVYQSNDVREMIDLMNRMNRK